MIIFMKPSFIKKPAYSTGFFFSYSLSMDGLVFILGIAMDSTPSLKVTFVSFSDFSDTA